MSDISSVLVREATVSDYDNFIRVYSEVEKLHREKLPWKFKEPDILFSKQDYKDMIDNSLTKVYLACVGQTAVGLVIAYIKDHKDIPQLQRRTYINIDTICVVEEHRKQGIGRRLLSEIENLARDNNIQDIQLNVREFNKNAKNFYLNYGFSPVSSIMRKVL